MNKHDDRSCVTSSVSSLCTVRVRTTIQVVWCGVNSHLKIENV